MPDMTDLYNTELKEADEAKFQQWVGENSRSGDLADYDLRGWWKKNGKQDARGHFSDEFKKPNHPTFSEDSMYHGQDGFKGGRWGGGEKDGWTFTPSKSNLEHMTPEELQGYFSSVEPDAKLIFPKSRTEKRYGEELPAEE